MATGLWPRSCATPHALGSTVSTQGLPRSGHCQHGVDQTALLLRSRWRRGRRWRWHSCWSVRAPLYQQKANFDAGSIYICYLDSFFFFFYSDHPRSFAGRHCISYSHNCDCFHREVSVRVAIFFLIFLINYNCVRLSVNFPEMLLFFF